MQPFKLNGNLHVLPPSFVADLEGKFATSFVQFGLIHQSYQRPHALFAHIVHVDRVARRRIGLAISNVEKVSSHGSLIPRGEESSK